MSGMGIMYVGVGLLGGVNMRVFDVASHDLGGLEPELLKESLGSIITVVAHPNDPAYAVARELDRRPGALAIVLGKEDEPIAIVVSEHVKQALRKHKGIETDSLEEALRRLSEDAAEAARDFRHEWLNSARPNVRWCRKHGHYVSPPCPYP